MVAVSDFSGLTSSAWALANADARAATDSLDRGIGRLHLQHIKAHRPRFRALCSHAVPDGLPGILRYQGFELAFGPFVVEKGVPGVAEERGELRPGIRRAHIDDANRLDAWPRRLGIDEVGQFAGLHAAPELLFRRHQNAEIERVHGDRDLDPFAAPGDDREHRGPQMSDPHVVLDLSHILFDGNVSRKRPRQHEFGLEHGFDPLHDAVESRRHPGNGVMLDLALDVGDAPPGIALVPAAVELFRRSPELYEQVVGQVLRFRLSPLLAPELDQSRFVATHDDPGVRAAYEGAPAQRPGMST